MLKALVEIPEADDAQDRAHQRKEAARGRNTGKEAPIHERLAESGGDKQSTPATHHKCGNEDEDAHEGFAFLADGGPAKVHPRNHQLRGRQLRGIYQANSFTYNAHDDREGQVQSGVRGTSALVCSPDEVHPETHGSDDAKEGELKANREHEDELVDAVDFQGST